MRIGMGVIAGVRGGPARYGCELASALCEGDAGIHLTIFTDEPRAFSRLQGPRVELVEVPLRWSAEQAWWDCKVALALRRRAIDLYHGTKGFLPPAEYVPYVVTIHDLAVTHLPETFSIWQRLHFRALLPRTIRLARRILTVSRHSRSDLLRAFPEIRPRVRITQPAASRIFRPEPEAGDERVLTSLGVRPPYVLYAGTVQPRKGVQELVDCFSSLKKEHPDLSLVIAGRCRPGYRPSFVRLPPANVLYVGEVTDQQLAALYRHAVAFCSPSRYEGFGLSFLEALQSGCPVLAPRTSSLPEVLGDAALFFSPDASDLEEALRVVLDNADLRSRLRQMGLDRAREFTWARTAAETLQVYREVIGEAG